MELLLVVKLLKNVEICEKAAEIFIGSVLLGGTNFLSTFQINNLIFDEKEKYRKSLL